MHSEDSANEPLPEKRYLTIGETSRLCKVKEHVLRYWEREIPQLRPVRRRNRRYYQREDVYLIRQIHALTQEGYTLDGVRQRLQGESSVAEVETPQAQAIRQAVAELEGVVKMLKEQE